MASGRRLGKYFYLKTGVNPNLVTEIRDAEDKPGADVITGDPRSDLEGNENQQLFLNTSTSKDFIGQSQWTTPTVCLFLSFDHSVMFTCIQWKLNIYIRLMIAARHMLSEEGLGYEAITITTR